MDAPNSLNRIPVVKRAGGEESRVPSEIWPA